MNIISTKYSLLFFTRFIVNTEPVGRKSNMIL